MPRHPENIIRQAVRKGIIACRIGLEPFGVLEHPHPVHDYLALNVQVASLAQRSQIPPAAIRLVQIQVVDRQSVPLFGIMRMPAAVSNAVPVRRFFHDLRDLFPVGRVFSCMISGHVFLG